MKNTEKCQQILSGAGERLHEEGLLATEIAIQMIAYSLGLLIGGDVNRPEGRSPDEAAKFVMLLVTTFVDQLKS